MYLFNSSKYRVSMLPDKSLAAVLNALLLPVVASVKTEARTSVHYYP